MNHCSFVAVVVESVWFVFVGWCLNRALKSTDFAGSYEGLISGCIWPYACIRYNSFVCRLPLYSPLFHPEKHVLSVCFPAFECEYHDESILFYFSVRVFLGLAITSFLWSYSLWILTFSAECARWPDLFPIFACLLSVLRYWQCQHCFLFVGSFIFSIFKG